MQGTVLSDIWQKNKPQTPQTPAFTGAMGATNPNTPAFADAMQGTAGSPTDAAARGVSNLSVKTPVVQTPPATPAAPAAPAGGTTPSTPAAPAQPSGTSPRAQAQIRRIQDEIFRIQNTFSTHEATQRAGMPSGNPDIDRANMALIEEARGRMQSEVYRLQQELAEWQNR